MKAIRVITTALRIVRTIGECAVLLLAFVIFGVAFLGG